MNHNFYPFVIKSILAERELLEQLAEEGAELSKAALKKIRANEYSANYTPTTPEQANADLWEEALDVLSILYLLDMLPPKDEVRKYWKFKRWAERLVTRGNKDE